MLMPSAQRLFAGQPPPGPPPRPLGRFPTRQPPSTPRGTSHRAAAALSRYVVRSPIRPVGASGVPPASRGSARGTASQRRRRRTGQCSGSDPVAAALPPQAAGLPGHAPAPLVRAHALERMLRLYPHLRPPGGAQGRHRRRCALPVPLLPVILHPLTGCCRSLGSLRSSGFATPASCLWRLP